MKKQYLLFTAAAMLTSAGFAQKADPGIPAIGVERQMVKISGGVPSWINNNARGGGPDNDDCAGAIMITPGATCITTDATYAGATESIPPIECATFEASVANDVWFYFVADGISTTIRVSGGPDTDPIVQLFAGDCASLNSLDCADATLVEGVEEIVFETTVGETYYYRTYYWPYTAPPEDFSFTTCVFATPPAPVNDLCEDAIIQTLDIGGDISATGTSMNALNTEGFNFTTVWEAFTITECADVYIGHCGTDGNVAVNAVFSDCPVSADNVVIRNSAETTTCDDGQPTNCFRDLPPGTYFVPIAGGAETYSIQVSASACQSAATNDDCANAISLTPSTSCNPTFANTNGTTESMAGTICNTFTGNANDDVWFSFEATQTEMTVAVQGSAEYDAVAFVMSGSCGSFTEIGCADATEFGAMEVVALNALEVGTTYYIRVYHWYAARPCDNSFSICVVEGSTFIGIDEHDGSDWSIYPNPTQGMVTIVNGGASALVDLQVLDLGGRLVHSSRAQMNTGAQQVLDISGKVAPGSYYLRIMQGDRSIVQRLMVN